MKKVIAFLVILILVFGFIFYKSNFHLFDRNDKIADYDVRIISLSPELTAINKGTINSPKYTSSGNISESISKDNLTADVSVVLVHPDDKFVYNVKVKNNGKSKAILKEIIQKSSNENFEFVIDKIEIGAVLNVGENKIFRLNVSYSGDKNNFETSIGEFRFSLVFKKVE